MDQPPLVPTLVVANRVREMRSARQWSAQRLAEEMERVGVDWNRGVVTKLETGRRESVSVAELFALACVFDVSPLALLLPSEPGEYAITPNRIADSTIRVLDWFLGRTGQPFGEPSPFVGWVGIPAGLPQPLVQREIHINNERGEEANRLRERNIALEKEAEARTSVAQGSPEALLALLERTERAAQAAEQRAEVAEAARQQQAKLIRDWQASLSDDLREQAGILLTRLHLESQGSSASAE